MSMSGHDSARDDLQPTLLAFHKVKLVSHVWLEM